MTEDVNRAHAQTGEEIFAGWKVAPSLRRWRDVINYQYLRQFGTTSTGVSFDFLYPSPVNREADSLELTAKTGAWAILVANGADPDDAAKVVGLPKMRMITKPPPGGLPAGTPNAGLVPAAIPGEAGQGGDALNSGRFRQFDPFDAYERQAAAWNRLAGAR